MPDGLARRVGNVEQPVQKQHRLTLDGQIQRQQALIGLHGDAGQVPDAFGVADNHLGQALRTQGGADTFNTLGFHEKYAFFRLFGLGGLHRAAAVLLGALAHHRGKPGREVALIPEADLMGNLADGKIGQHQQLLGACDAGGQ